MFLFKIIKNKINSEKNKKQKKQNLTSKLTKNKSSQNHKTLKNIHKYT